MANTSVNNKSKKQSFTADDFKVTTKEELLTASYGKKGTASRKKAEARIKAIAKTLG
jgi:hypothetical protein